MEEPENRKQSWIGNMTELYEELWKRLADLGISYNLKKFPDSHIALGKRINEIVVNLKGAGIHVERYRERRTKGGKVERLIK